MKKKVTKIKCMTAFAKKKLTKTKRVCLRLKEAREAAGLSLAELSVQTKISKKHLKALEECRFDDIPFAIIYQKNFVRCYAEAVGIPADVLLDQFLTEEAKPKINTNIGYKKIKKNRLQNLPLLLKAGMSMALVLTLVIYLGLQVRSIVRPPNLSIYAPRDGYVTTNSSVIVNGETGSEVHVYINGQEINTETDGRFEQILNLSPGINTLVISAKKRHGKITSQTRHVILKQDLQLSLGN